MFTYIIRRILQFIPVFLGITLILFALRAFIPGDPVAMIAGERPMPADIKEQIIKANHLDEPLLNQYGYYLSDLVQGDLGTSYQRNLPVLDIFMEKFPYTAKLALCAIIIEILLGITAGIISAVRRYSFIDALTTVSTSILVSVPVFWLGLLLQLFFGLFLKDLTNGVIALPQGHAGGPTSQYADWVHYILPAFTLASVSLAYTARIMRSQLLEVMNADYMRTAIAKGLTKGKAIFRHALKNAMIPVVTFIGIDFGAMMSGAILTETVFSWPGIGLEIYHAINQRDWPIVMGGVVLIVIIVMLINLIIDISYALFDPRIRYGKKNAEE